MLCLNERMEVLGAVKLLTEEEQQALYLDCIADSLKVSQLGSVSRLMKFTD